MNASADPASRDASGPRVTPEIAAEASVWIARLHGPDRGPEMERECVAWQAISAAHRLAFERCTDVWESVPGVRLADAFASASRGASDTGGGGEAGSGSQTSERRIWILAPALVVILAAGGGYWNFVRGSEAFGTQVGEQQQLMLADGTRMTLNTNTQVRVDMGASQRTVDLQRGEALFEVSKDPERPFVVRAAGSEVVAIGTVFSVRVPAGSSRGAQESAVTLIEGQVAVRPNVARGVREPEAGKPVLMQPGERLRWVPQELGARQPARPQLDRPRLETVLAWRRNEVDFEDASLIVATSEMNRYSRTPIVLLGDGSLGRLRVSGLYRTGDSASFAQAVAALHGLQLREQAGRLELSLSQ